MTVLFDNALESQLSAEKKDVWQTWLKTGLPSKKQERWRYNSLAHIQNILLSAQPETVEAIQHDSLIEHNDYQLTFQEGVLITPTDTLPEALSILPMNEAKPVISDFGFSGLNAALSLNHYQITIAKGAIIDKPIVITHLASSSNSHLHLSIVAEQNSDVRFIHYPVRTHSDRVLMTESFHVDVKHNARVNCLSYIPASESLSKMTMMQVHQEAHSVFHHEKIDFAAELSRLELDVHLNGEGAEATMQGIYYGHQDLHIDNYLRVYHNASHTRSTQHYRGLADGKSTTVFNGAVHVAKGVQGIEADQSNPNLLLSNQASMNTKPELVIYADDVKCSHGATVGELDETALFYLRSRGIGLKEARAMLIHAFLNEILSELPEGVFLSQMHADLAALEAAHA